MRGMNRDLPDVAYAFRHSRSDQGADHGFRTPQRNARHLRKEISTPYVVGQNCEKLATALLGSILTVDAAVVRGPVRAMDDARGLRKVGGLPTANPNLGFVRTRVLSLFRQMLGKLDQHVVALQSFEPAALKDCIGFGSFNPD